MKFPLLIASLITNGQAHILMKNPPSDKYKGRNDIPESQKDYSLTNPMSPDRIGNLCGSVEKIVSSGNYAAGSAVNVELEGHAVHEGGHCQFGFSYDRSTFAVTHKVFGNCVSGSKSYSIPIPSSAPSGPVTFFWAWFNREGNREMYMNCGQITITGGSGTSISGKAILVANLSPGDVKFPEGFADDFGKDLFENQPTVSVQPSGGYNPGQNTQNSSEDNTKSPTEIKDTNSEQTIQNQPKDQGASQNPSSPHQPDSQNNYQEQGYAPQKANAQGDTQSSTGQGNTQNNSPQASIPEQANSQGNYQQPSTQEQSQAPNTQAGASNPAGNTPQQANTQANYQQPSTQQQSQAPITPAGVSNPSGGAINGGSSQEYGRA
ncbi:hypothetical protein DSO57_1013325 [Entomophthora muscae]|uniref:Uncharacterized protein n=1 Tax=Entomophthora muscae TaxID=34485 RepID=A0ACC2UG47_9FUNG|nr:hypothetical protein DSO57_1013325 [Entomophthora muscae]